MARQQVGERAERAHGFVELRHQPVEIAIEARIVAVAGVERGGQAVDLGRSRPASWLAMSGRRFMAGPAPASSLRAKSRASAIVAFERGQRLLELRAVDDAVEALGGAGDVRADRVEVDAVDLGQQLGGRGGDAVEAADFARRHDEVIAVACRSRPAARRGSASIATTLVPVSRLGVQGGAEARV